MPTPIRVDEVRRLLDEGAQLVEVLEERQYEAAHLPGAVHIPAWELTRERAGQLDRDRPVIFYCFDNLWDLSSRAACLLELYGFDAVYDYVDGKVDWMAHGLPVEGDRGPYVGDVLVDVPTCRPDEKAADVRARGHDRVAVVAGTGVVVGEVDTDRLNGAAPDATVLDVMEVVPSTLRPSVPLADVDERVAGRLVTTGDGVLLGAVDPSAVKQ